MTTKSLARTGGQNAHVGSNVFVSSAPDYVLAKTSSFLLHASSLYHLMVLLHHLAPGNNGCMLLPCFQAPGFSHPMPRSANTRNTIHSQQTALLQFQIRNSLVNSHFRNPALFPIALNPPFPAKPTQRYPLDPNYIVPIPQSIQAHSVNSHSAQITSRLGPNQAGSIREWISHRDNEGYSHTKRRLCLT
mgnify:CR=1 FL=1